MTKTGFRTSIIGLMLFVWGGQLSAQLVWTANLDSINSFSSPRVEDLNDDGVDDVVIGGGLEGTPSLKGVVAINGANGSELWTAPSYNQMFGSPVFMNVNGTGANDVIICGRDAQLIALDGNTGTVLWEVYPDTSLIDSIGRHNFYNPMATPDQNNDNTTDLVVAFGGGAAGEEGPDENDRPPGHIMLISGLDGEVLAKMVVPDSAETYSAVLVEGFGTNDLWAVYGTGGETLPGGMWRTRISDVLAEFPDNSQLLHQSDSNGYVAPPSLADLTGDDILDVVVNNHAGDVAVIDGATGNEIWERVIQNGEASSAPCIGRFNSDATPDIATVMAIGGWPHYTDYIRLVFDGSDGSTLDSTSLVDWNLSSMLAADLNQDGVDEIISAFDKRHYNSVLDTMIYTVTVEAIDPTDWTIVFEYGPVTGANSFYTPHLSDLDGNGLIDLVYASTEDSLFFVSEERLIVRRLELPITPPSAIAWGSYLGTLHDGAYYSTDPVAIENEPESLRAVSFPGRLYNSMGCLLDTDINSQIQLSQTMNERPFGVYFFQSTTDRGIKIVNSGRQ